MQIRCSKCGATSPQEGCGKEFCPHFARSTIRFNVSTQLTKEEFLGSSPAPFVGRFGYPNVNVGILSPPEQIENAWEYDAPRHWARNSYSIPKIMEFRSSLVNSRTNMNIRSPNKLLGISQEVGMASKPVDLEISLTQKPKFRLNTDSHMAPTGPNAELKNAVITSNPKISSKVEKVVDDHHLKSVDALNYLYKKDFDENFLSKLLSVGTLGIKDNRRLVPTRWSITAVDDTLGKTILNEIRSFPESDYQAFFGSHLGNYYLILLFPDVWQYELFEMYQPKTKVNQSEQLHYTTDYEPFAGRKYYAEDTAGGYYAARLPILEKLKEMKRQSSVLVIRVITDEYAAPLGVWVVREASRNSISSKPIRFASKELMLTYAKHLIRKKFGFDLDLVLNKSILLKNFSSQMKLSRFI